MTASESLEEAESRLAQAGRTNARQEARWMLEAIAGKPLPDLDSLLVTEQGERLQEFLRRRERGEPLQYVLGSADFRTITLKVDRRALIPRPETEGLVELGLEAIRSNPQPTVLDVGTGSGAIALSIAAEHPGALIIACEADGEALALARENGKLSGLDRRITWKQADLFAPDFVQLVGGSFDLVMSNPPYVSEAEYSQLPPEVRDWEPAAALLAGPDGLGAIRRLAQVGGELTSPGGSLMLEIGAGQRAEVLALFKKSGWQAFGRKDLGGKDRYVITRRA